MPHRGVSTDPFDTSDNTVEEEMASGTAVSLRIPASPFSPPLLQRFLDQRHHTEPTGELRVDDILQIVFLFLAPARQTLFAVSRVSRAWRDRTELLPQWALLGPVPDPRSRPSRQIMRAYRSNVTGDWKGGAFCAGCRTEFLAERVAVIRRWDAEARIAALLWWLKRFLGVSTTMLLPAGSQLVSCRVAVLAMNSVWKGIEAASFWNCAMGFFCGWITAVVLEIFQCILEKRGSLRWSRGNFGARVVSLVRLQPLLAYVLAAIVLPTITGLQTDASNLRNLQNAPIFSLSPCPAYYPYRPPYYVTFTAGAPSSWIFDTAPPVPLSNETDRVLVAFLRLNSTACRGTSGFGTAIGVIVPPGGLSADWWEGLQRSHSNRTLTFRTTRWHPAFPLPWYMYPAQPWDRVVPARWLPSMIPVIGVVPATNDDFPRPRIAYLERVIWGLPWRARRTSSLGSD